MIYATPIFDREKCTLLLSVDTDSLDTKNISAFAHAKGFFAKTTFHITVMGFALGRKIKEAIEKSENASQTLAHIESLVSKTEWQFLPFDEYYEIEKTFIFNDKNNPQHKIQQKRYSIIQTLSCPAIEYFLLQIEKLLGVPFEMPFPHITLFVKGDKGAQTEGIGIQTAAQFQEYNPKKIDPTQIPENNVVEKKEEKKIYSIHTIVLPTRAQADTIAAIFLLKNFGETYFTNINSAKVEMWQMAPEGKTITQLFEEGFLLLDLAGSPFDHHSVKEQTTASDLVTTCLGIESHPAIAKLLEYVRRDDFFGKGTISNDALDRAFGLSGLIASLNRTHANNPAKVVEIVLPLIDAHFQEEMKRTTEMPKEVEEKLAKGEATTFSAKQRDRNLKIIYIESTNPSLPGYLRSQNGGRFDVVVQRLPSGHVNILTRPTKRVDLRPLAATLRNAELLLKGKAFNSDTKRLSSSGRLEEIPEWYFDDVTNSIFNGGINPVGVEPTKIPVKSLEKLLIAGLKIA